MEMKLRREQSPFLAEVFLELSELGHVVIVHGRFRRGQRSQHVTLKHEQTYILRLNI